MTQNGDATRHLTEDELEEVLLGVDIAERKVHLAECAACRGTIDEFRDSLKLFNQASMGWSEAKSCSMTRDLARPEPARRMNVRAVWACGGLLVAVLAGAVAPTAARHTGAETRTTPVAGASADAQTENVSEIAGDNAMMRQIDSVISTPEPSPSQLYGQPSRTDQGRDANGTTARN
jgi:hypothetical protein